MHIMHVSLKDTLLVWCMSAKVCCAWLYALMLVTKALAVAPALPSLRCCNDWQSSSQDQPAYAFCTALFLAVWTIVSMLMG